MHNGQWGSCDTEPLPVEKIASCHCFLLKKDPHHSYQKGTQAKQHWVSLSAWNRTFTCPHTCMSTPARGWLVLPHTEKNLLLLLHPAPPAAAAAAAWKRERSKRVLIESGFKIASFPFLCPSLLSEKSQTPADKTVFNPPPFTMAT